MKFLSNTNFNFNGKTKTLFIEILETRIILSFSNKIEFQINTSFPYPTQKSLTKNQWKLFLKSAGVDLEGIHQPLV